jgi:hypothetical protein
LSTRAHAEVCKTKNLKEFRFIQGLAAQLGTSWFIAPTVCKIVTEHGLASIQALRGIKRLGEANWFHWQEIQGVLDLAMEAFKRQLQSCSQASNVISEDSTATESGQVTSSDYLAMLAQTTNAIDIPVLSSLGFVLNPHWLGGQRGLKARAGGKSTRQSGSSTVIQVATVSAQNWTVADTEIKSANLFGMVPPVRWLGYGNQLIAGLLLYQVRVLLG